MTSNIYYVSPGKTLEYVQGIVDLVESTTDVSTILIEGLQETWDGCLLIENQIGIRLLGLNAVIRQSATEVPTIKFNNCSRINVSGLRLIGKGTEDPFSGSVWNGVAGVYFLQSDYITIRDCICENHAGGSIILGGVCNNVRIENLSTFGMGSTVIESNNRGDYGIAASGVDITAILNNLTVTNNKVTGHCQGIAFNWGSNHLFTNNLIHDIPGQHGFYITARAETNVVANMIHDTAEVAIKIAFNGTTDELKPVLVSGNVIHNAGTYGIQLQNVSTNGSKRYNAHVCGNNIYDCANIGIYVQGQSDVVVESNKIKNVTRGIYHLNSNGIYRNNSIRQSELLAFYSTGMDGDTYIDGLNILDAPINSTGSTNFLYVNSIYLDNPSTSVSVFLNNITNKYVDYPESTKFQNMINNVSSDTTLEIGLLWNKTSKPNISSGTVNETIAGIF